MKFRCKLFQYNEVNKYYVFFNKLIHATSSQNLNYVFYLHVFIYVLGNKRE